MLSDYDLSDYLLNIICHSVEKLNFLAVFLFICLPYFSETASFGDCHPDAGFTIVIDAGHGGKDSGALGANVYEKDIALKLALRLGAYINSNLDNVKVLYTRTTDKFVPLHKRVQLANQNNADIFFSIHCNSMISSPSPVHGTETYVMGLHNAKENLNVAKRENKVVLLEQDYSANYSGYDPNSSEGHIMLSMFQNAHINQSLSLAQKIEKQFSNTAKRKSRGVKQAGFVVLRTTTMPSVLVETGFLTNAEEEKYLSSEKGQVYIASAMFRAVKDYILNVDSKTFPPVKEFTARGSNQPVDISKKAVKKSSNPFNKSDKEPDVLNVPELNEVYPASSPQVSANVTFRVQLASSGSPLNLKSLKWSQFENLECIKISNSYKCFSIAFDKLSDAVTKQSFFRKNGFSDAFIVAFKNGKKIPLSEANK